jgi:transcriptional regulator with XRE-family HTH domain
MKLLLRRDPKSLRDERRARGWKQVDISAASGVGVDAIGRAESGRPISLENAGALAAACGVTLEMLGGGQRGADEFSASAKS